MGPNNLLGWACWPDGTLLIGGVCVGVNPYMFVWGGANFFYPRWHGTKTQPGVGGGPAPQILI